MRLDMKEPDVELKCNRVRKERDLTVHFWRGVELLVWLRSGEFHRALLNMKLVCNVCSRERMRATRSIIVRIPICSRAMDILLKYFAVKCWDWRKRWIFRRYRQEKYYFESTDDPDEHFRHSFSCCGCVVHWVYFHTCWTNRPAQDKIFGKDDR